MRIFNNHILDCALLRLGGFMSALSTFGQWLHLRHKALDLTQEELAKRARCSVSAIRKIEADERHPSRQIAGLLAESLEIYPQDRRDNKIISGNNRFTSNQPYE